MKALLFAVALVTLLACGPDADLLSSGTRHACNIQDFTAQLAADPGNESIQAQLSESAAFLEINIDQAGEGNRAEMQAAIEEAVAGGACD